MKRTITLATTFVLTCGLAYGEERPGSDSEPLEFFDAYVGTWRWRGTLEEDFDFAKTGEVGTGTLTWRWAYDKKAIDWRWDFDFPSKRSGTKGTMAWDASQNKLVGFGVSSDGGLIWVTSRSLDPLEFEVKSIDPQGNITSHVEHFTPSGDEMRLKSTERAGGTQPEKGLEYTFQRVKRSARRAKRSEQP